jgi:hypothetical protein
VRTKGLFGKKKKRLNSCDPEFTTETFSGVFNTQAEAFAHRGAFIVMANGGRGPSKRLKKGSPGPAPLPKKVKDLGGVMARKRAEVKSKAAEQRRSELHCELRKVSKRTDADTIHGVTHVLLGSLKASVDVAAVTAKIGEFIEKDREKAAEFNAWVKARKAKAGRHPVPTRLLPSYQKKTQAALMKRLKKWAEARDQIAPFLLAGNTEGLVLTPIGRH